MTATENLPVGAAAGGGTRLVSEPAFDLLFSEIIAYTGSYVAHSAASHDIDVRRSTKADGMEGDEDGAGADEEGDDGVIMEPSLAAVGAGDAVLPVSCCLCRPARCQLYLRSTTVPPYLKFSCTTDTADSTVRHCGIVLGQ